jgi:hypothetical protein
MAMTLRRTHWVVAGMVGALCLIAAAIAATALTAHYTRLSLREQLTALQHSIAPMQLEVQHLNGTLHTSRLQVHLQESEAAELALDAWELDLRLHHRLFSSTLTGEIRLLSHGVNATPLAIFTGHVSYHPWSGAMLWALRLDGQKLPAAATPHNAWQMDTWSAELDGTERQIQVDLRVPQINHTLSHSGLRDLHLQLDLHRTNDNPLQGQLQAHVAVHEAHGPSPTGIIRCGPTALDLDIRRTPTQWSFETAVRAMDLDHAGIPVLRFSSLTQHASGFTTPIEGNGAFWWNSRLDLNALSNYGPLRGEVRVLDAHNAPPHGTRLQLHAALPVGLWGLLKTLRPDWLGTWERNGMTRTQGNAITLDALLHNDGTWYAPAS